MTLTDYINTYYNGNKRQFAIANNMKANQVTPMTKVEGQYHVIDGRIFIKKRKLVEPPVKTYTKAELVAALNEAKAL